MKIYILIILFLKEKKEECREGKREKPTNLKNLQKTKYPTHAYGVGYAKPRNYFTRLVSYTFGLFSYSKTTNQK